jgi:pimeloyl-ACP methyl ester carboxylesterase
LVRGEHDAIAPACWINELSASSPYINTASIKNAAHAAHYSAPDELAELVCEFVNRLTING